MDVVASLLRILKGVSNTYCFPIVHYNPTQTPVHCLCLSILVLPLHRSINRHTLSLSLSLSLSLCLSISLSISRSLPPSLLSCFISFSLFLSPRLSIISISLSNALSRNLLFTAPPRVEAPFDFPHNNHLYWLHGESMLQVR